MQPKVLVIEDLAEIQQILRRILERHGFHVLCASDGPEGIALAEREVPDLVLLDLTLPTMNGWHVAEQLRASAQMSNVPRLAMSGNLEEHSDKTLFAGYIAKPFNLSALVELVKAHAQPRTSQS